jgi:hypothetical protein
MKRWALVCGLVAMTFGVAGCADEIEPPRYAVLTPSERAQTRPAEGQVIVRHTPPPEPVVEDELGSKPRLRHTLRLGSDGATYPEVAGSRPVAPPPPPGVTVVVNNNITQQQVVAVGGGGYGPRGAYGAPGYGTYGRPTYGSSPSISAPVQPQAPLSSPPIGGNWAPPRNFGPPAMR